MATGKSSDHQLDLSFVSNIVFSPDSKVLATAGCKKDEQNNCVQGEVVLWNVITGKTIGHVQGYTDHDIYLAFSPDSKVLASAGCNQGQNYNCDQNKVNFWDVQKQKPIDLPPSETPYFLDRKATSPDGKTLAFAGCKSVFFDCAEGVITLWNIETGQPLGQYISHTNFIRDIAFSPDGIILASEGCGKVINGDCFQEEIILWDIATGKPSGQHLTIDMELYSSRGEIIFSPDSKTIVSTIENLLYLWNVESHQSIGRPLTLNSNGLSSFGFIQNGKLLVTTSLWANFDLFTQTARILLWDMDPELCIKKSCERAGRNFTRAEWERYFPNEEYHQTCEQWPLEA